MKIRVFLVAAMLALAPSAARAFDCGAFLTQSGLDKIEPITMKLVPAYPIVESQLAATQRADLVDIEEVGPKRDRKVLATARIELTGDQAKRTPALHCRMFRAGFRLTAQFQDDLYLQSEKTDRRTDVLILQFRAATRQEDGTLGKNWETNLAFKLGAKGDLTEFEFTYKNFSRLLANPKPTTAGQILALTAESLNRNARQFLPNDAWPGSGGFAATALAICEPVDCRTLVEWAKGYKTPEERPADTPQPAVSPSVARVEAPASGGETPEPVAPVNPSREPSAVAPPPEDIPEPPAPVVTVAPGPILRDGRDPAYPVPLSDAETGGLACLLSALSPGLFVPAPDCPRETAVRWSAGDYGLHQSAPGEWTVFRRERPIPRRLEVRLPRGQDGLQCQMTATYESERNAAPSVVRLSPAVYVSGTQATFTAELRRPPLAGPDGKVAFEIDVSKRADCGTSSLRLEASPQAETLAIDLTLPNSTTTELLHVLMFNDIGHPLDDRGRVALARTMTEAVVSAHRRASHFLGNLAWPVTGARIGALSQAGGNVLAEATGTGLRTDGARLLTAVVQVTIESLAADGGRFQPEAAILANGLRGIASRRPDVDRVVAALIGPAGRPAIFGEPLNPCAAGLYEEVRTTLENGEGPSLSLLVFPIVRAEDLNRLQLAELLPTDFAPGFTRCRSTPEGVGIYPFIAESWREPSDVARRFGVALSDRLANLIEEIVPIQVR